jgi:predicted site-specific integrase-resolvase
MPTANRVGLYARVSTRDKGHDTENQLAQLRAFCAANHWPIVAEFVDYAAGKRSDREQFANARRFSSSECSRLYWAPATGISNKRVLSLTSFS